MPGKWIGPLVKAESIQLSAVSSIEIRKPNIENCGWDFVARCSSFGKLKEECAHGIEDIRDHESVFVSNTHHPPPNTLSPSRVRFLIGKLGSDVKTAVRDIR